MGYWRLMKFYRRVLRAPGILQGSRLAESHIDSVIFRNTAIDMSLPLLSTDLVLASG